MAELSNAMQTKFYLTVQLNTYWRDMLRYNTWVGGVARMAELSNALQTKFYLTVQLNTYWRDTLRYNTWVGGGCPHDWIV